MLAIDRLKDSGEWAVPVMIETLRDPRRTEELALIRWALPQLGLPAVNPLVVVMQDCPALNIKLIVAEALGKIGYHGALPCLVEMLDAENTSPELKQTIKDAIKAIDSRSEYAGPNAAWQYLRLANAYYNHMPSLQAPANQTNANIWFWNDKEGLVSEQVEREAFDELMTMRNCEDAIRLDDSSADAIALWLSSFFRLEANGHAQPQYFGENHADAATYALTTGPQYLQRVLARSLANKNRSVALGAIKALERNAGQESLLYHLMGRRPLIEALSFADREVRFNAALAIAHALPLNTFEQSNLVVPILAEALLQKGHRYALVVDPDSQRRNEIIGQLRRSEAFAEVVGGEHFAVTVEQAAALPGFDLIILARDIKRPDLDETLQLIAQDYRLALCPTLVVADTQSLAAARKKYENNSFLKIILPGQTAEEMITLAEKVMQHNYAANFAPQMADEYAVKAALALQALAITRNPVLDSAVAQSALLQAARDERTDVQAAAVAALARINSQAAQRALAKLALDEQVPMDIRLMTFNLMSTSCKAFGNLLLAEQIEAIYAIVSSVDADPDLRNLAAEAYGSLNLPSSKVRQLILDQIQAGL